MAFRIYFFGTAGPAGGDPQEVDANALLYSGHQDEFTDFVNVGYGGSRDLILRLRTRDIEYVEKLEQD